MISKKDITNRVTTWSLEKLEEYNQLEKDLNTVSDYQWVASYDADMDRFNCITIVDGVTIEASPKNYKGHFSFYANYRKLKYIDYDDLKSLEMSEPNNVGVLSAKKVSDWVHHWVKLYKALEKLSREKAKKVDDYIAKFQALGGQVSSSSYNSNNISGRLEKNCIRLSFDISRSGYISQKMDLVTYPRYDYLNLFEELSNNGYKGAK